MKSNNSIKIAFIGGGSQGWAPNIIRDIIFKDGLDKVNVDFHLLDVDMPRALAIKALFDVKLAEWGVDRVSITPTDNARQALKDADFVLITISTGRLESMRHDLAIPEKYGIYHTVGDTAGPAGWSRALRNIPVFSAYAKLIARLAPNAFVLNYTNPMGALTSVLAGALGRSRVVGLCHGAFECYDSLAVIFGLDSEKRIQMRYGGLNHFFWILDFTIDGEDGYRLLRRKLRGRNFGALIKKAQEDAMGWSSNNWVAGELFENYGRLPYFGDRHTCEFFNCYITDLEVMKRFKLVRTPIEEREAGYAAAAESIRLWTNGEDTDTPLTREPSRETAADIIKAITFNEPFCDVVNTINAGQIPNLPLGSVVETPGYIDAGGFTPLGVGPLPDAIRTTVAPHADMQMRTVSAGVSGDEDAALMALLGDPVCAHLTGSDTKKMGRELIEANKKFIPVGAGTRE